MKYISSSSYLGRGGRLRSPLVLLLLLWAPAFVLEVLETEE
jgi:hypothetical protein